MNIDKNTRWSE